ncbi:MAG: hypothetical protein UU88_C0016G0003 [Parcubacteria group bacterium GW2011_GWC1_42_11]|uniref:Uncharacterized protein n=1 Tax=Candidatus Nomurabacteria bacterium GW2011_GWC2_42_20 TaxID=1618756 RepID=A0A0G0ZF16_9BACT|nr:MAG: hypothetical protein UU88_C0016G0003 [Parcubacteria group bacterium GW2011_GWC1_42_11]KKS47340.1 MAG: hypothetical protein UV12_C0008G0008 [Candidatus Nomurabacteria bacterium GW2011_GWC2_42_20]KKS58946.1 MAG: hypothetical protein UV24_C0011G0003 [Candidatus Nomurabacteria bacterium GW2011_GWA2_42_41]KKT09453.1 MAG: hypothetical protein UV86_C0007G0012 [Candidatus Nomurabacteria bacterium GW2011_GWB1_43_20]TAN36211.1 MAG: FtsX-like permease family protein [Patescibacteria group bacteriu
MTTKTQHIKRVIQVAFFIALKNIQRGSLAVKIVTISILLLTFLNLTVVGGLLNGIVDDIGNKIKNSLFGDVVIQPSKEYSYIQNPGEVIDNLKNNTDILAYSERLLSGAIIESGYREVTGGSEIPRRVGASLAGVSVDHENQTTDISKKIIAGRFLAESDWNTIVLGSTLTEGYTKKGASGGDTTLGHVLIGEKVRIKFSNNVSREFTVVGIVNTKSSVVDQRAYIQYKELRQILDLPGNKYSEIAIVAKVPAASIYLAEYLGTSVENKKNDVKTLNDAIPSGVSDVKVAFTLIGNIVAIIAVLVGLVTVFVIIFVNASSRRRYLGILKAQGIDPSALILSYVIQALFYTVIGIVLGVVVLFGFLQGYFVQNPLSLPMADGSLLLDTSYLSVRVVVLLVSTLISAFIPAWFIIRQNTLNAILGR